VSAAELSPAETQPLVQAQADALLASISSVLIGAAADGTVTNWNASAESLLGIPAAAAVRRPFAECGARWDWTAVRAGVGRCLAERKPVRLETFRFDRTDGSEGVLGATIYPVRESAERTGFLLLAADLTQKMALEAQLRHAQKMESVGQLAAGIAHEINTPIQYAGDNLRFLQEAFSDLLQLFARIEQAGGTPGATPQELAQAIGKAAAAADLPYLRDEVPRAIQQGLEGIDRVSRIVRAMKEFSHPARDKTATDINKAIESTITVARNEWKYVADMVTELDPSLPPVICLPGEINQVVLNLIVNAAHAIADVVGDGSGSKGTITVGTSRVGEWIEIRVKDTGAGIPESIRAKIFDPFFTTKEVGKGTGQGLSIVHTVVVKEHGGSVSFESQVGRGTTFFVRLPLGAASAAASESGA
jgi:PAS domain S-box-containing protein